MLKHILKEESGLLTFEWILLVTILVIGVIAGLAAVRDAVNEELSDIAASMGAVNQGYGYSGIHTELFQESPAGLAQANSFSDVTPIVQGSLFEDGGTTVDIETVAGGERNITQTDDEEEENGGGGGD